MDNTCVFCGEPIPEGRMVCPACEDKYNNMEHKLPVKDYRVGDVCIYSFGDKNKSCSVVQIVKILEDERGIAEVKFLNVVNDDSGNGLFNFLLKSGKTMNASFKYLKNVTPRVND